RCTRPPWSATSESWGRSIPTRWWRANSATSTGTSTRRPSKPKPPLNRSPGGGGDLVADVRDEAVQVAAVDRPVAEAGAGPVAVRVQPAAADPDERAGEAGVRQRLLADLPGRDGRQEERGVERVAQHVQECARRALVRGLERVHLLDGAVGLDDHHGHRGQAQGLAA